MAEIHDVDTGSAVGGVGCFLDQFGVAVHGAMRPGGTVALFDRLSRWGCENRVDPIRSPRRADRTPLRLVDAAPPRPRVRSDRDAGSA